jgi:hypothetical protein
MRMRATCPDESSAALSLKNRKLLFAPMTTRSAATGPENCDTPST